MKNLLFLCSWLFALTTSSCLNQGSKNDSAVKGEFVKHENFSSKFVEARDIEIYLPSIYAENPTQKFAVLYMHDGQNLFHEEGSYAGEWGVDECLEKLLEKNAIEPCIVVGIPNSGETRFPEYLPQKAAEAFPDSLTKLRLEHLGEAQPFSDNYLKFLVEEVKPFIDENYRTKTDRAHTYVAGSSMGGLISLYAICEYPDVFGGAACLSTHWSVDLKNRHSILGETLVNYFAENLPSPENHSIYFDYGTKGLDAHYEPYQKMMDDKMREAGFTENKNWMTKKYDGADHNEKSWRERLHIPLKFVLAKKTD